MDITAENVFSLQKQTNQEVVPLLDRAFLYLEMGDFAKAGAMCEAALNKDARNAQAYTYLLMSELQVKRIEDLSALSYDFRQNNNYKMALRFADEEQKAFLEESAVLAGNRGNTAEKDARYSYAVKKMMGASTSAEIAEAAQILESVGNWRDAAGLAANCRTKQRELQEKESASKKKTARFVAFLLIAVLAVALLLAVLLPMLKSDDEGDSRESKEWSTTSEDADATGHTTDAKTESTEEASPEERKYQEAIRCLESGKHTNAYELFEELGDYKESESYIEKFVSVYAQVTEYKNGKLYATYNYSYDDTGNLLKESKTYDNGQTYTKTYTYDEEGKLLKHKEVAPYWSDDFEYTYDNQGRLIKQVKDRGNLLITTEYTYDENGKVERENHYSSQGDKSYILVFYDSLGNVTARLEYADEKCITDITYTYDENNRIIEERTWSYLERDTPVTNIYYTYDENGNLINKAYEHISREDELYNGDVYEYTYEEEIVFYKD